MFELINRLSELLKSLFAIGLFVGSLIFSTYLINVGFVPAGDFQNFIALLLIAAGVGLTIVIYIAVTMIIPSSIIFEALKHPRLMTAFFSVNDAIKLKSAWPKSLMSLPYNLKKKLFIYFSLSILGNIIIIIVLVKLQDRWSDFQKLFQIVLEAWIALGVLSMQMIFFRSHYRMLLKKSFFSLKLKRIYLLAFLPVFPSIILLIGYTAFSQLIEV